MKFFNFTENENSLIIALISNLNIYLKCCKPKITTTKKFDYIYLTVIILSSPHIEKKYLP